MNLWLPNNKNRLKTVLLGNVPTPEQLKGFIKKPIPKIIEKMLSETHEDLATIKNKYTELGVKVVSYPVIGKDDFMQNTINVRDGFIVIDDKMYITKQLNYLKDLYRSVDQSVLVPHGGDYCPNIFIHDDYAILDGLSADEYKYWRELLSSKRRIITAFNNGHSDGIYCNIADKLWLTNGEALNFSKYWPEIPYINLENNWSPVTDFFTKNEVRKTKGRYLIYKQDLQQNDIDFIDEYFTEWVGYCEETLFDLNISIIDENNILAISQNNAIYEKLEAMEITVHKVPFRHRFFWDGGLHCITNDLVREQ